MYVQKIKKENKMTNSVSFSGRETMLSPKIIKTAKDAAIDKAHEYVGIGKIYSAAEQLAAKPVSKTQDAQQSYAISHGMPAAILAAKLGKKLDVKA